MDYESCCFYGFSEEEANMLALHVWQVGDSGYEEIPRSLVLDTAKKVFLLTQTFSSLAAFLLLGALGGKKPVYGFLNHLTIYSLGQADEGFAHSSRKEHTHRNGLTLMPNNNNFLT